MEKEDFMKPELAEIVSVKKETENLNTYTISFLDKDLQKHFYFTPGQFIELSVFGAGEAPFTFSSPPSRKHDFDITVMKAGKLTEKLFEMNKGELIGIRGPFGNGWPVSHMKDKHIVLVGGGSGFTSLYSLAQHLLEIKPFAKTLSVFYGAKTKEDFLFKETLFGEWKNSSDISLHLAIDSPKEGWSGATGYATDLLNAEAVQFPKETIACSCGPEGMMNAANQKLSELGVSEERIFSSFERLMYCGIGRCGHCMIGYRHVCIDGPIFSFKEVKEFPKET